MKKSTSYRLEIITPERIVYNQDVVFAVIPSGLGPIGVLPGHAPLLGTVINGILKARDTDRHEILAFVRNGFFMISHEGVSIIARSAELRHQIDVQRASAARERALKILSSKKSGIDMERAREALRRAELRLKVAEGAVTF